MSTEKIRVETKNIMDLDIKDLKKLWGENSKGMRPKEWRLMPNYGDDHGIATAWTIYQLIEGGLEGDIEPVGSGEDYWESLDIVRCHNKTLGFYNGE